MVKSSGVNHHGAGRCVRKPSAAAYLFRLAGSAVLPLSIAVKLHPRVVVIAVGPARRIDLARRNAEASQYGDCKCGLLSASSVAVSVHGQRSQRPVVCGAVCDLRGTPVVGLKDCLLHASALQTVRRLLVKQLPARQNVLLINSRPRDVIQENILRNPVLIRSLLP